MLTLLGLYRLIPRRVRPLARVLALLVCQAIVTFLAVRFFHILTNLPAHPQRHDTSKQHPAKEAR